MFSAIVILLSMAFGDVAKLRGMEFKPINKITFFIFISNLIILMILGAKHVESPFIEFGQIATLIYFVYFISNIPLSNQENVLGKLFSSKVSFSSTR